MFSRCFLCAFTLLLTSCGLFQKPAYEQDGYASVIADRYNGHYTTSGQVYQPGAYTAAHNSLPFGTQVTVKNLQTGRKVSVVVNDRFPYYQGRLINLSAAAAQYIGIPYHQMAPVRVTAKTVASQGYAYQQPQRAPAPAHHSSYHKPAGRSTYRTPAYNGGAAAYGGGAPAYGNNQRLPAFNGPAPAYQPTTPSYQYQAPAYNSTPAYPPSAPTYQPQQPAGNYLPGFNGAR